MNSCCVCLENFTDWKLITFGCCNDGKYCTDCLVKLKSNNFTKCSCNRDFNYIVKLKVKVDQDGTETWYNDNEIHRDGD